MKRLKGKVIFFIKKIIKNNLKKKYKEILDTRHYDLIIAMQINSFNDLIRKTNYTSLELYLQRKLGLGVFSNHR